MQKVTLYTKLNCHLCDQAYEMLLDLAFEQPLEIDILDITHTHNDIETANYIERIPVIGRSDIGPELAWPFTLDQLREYLKS